MNAGERVALVTGARGFLGRHVARALEASGFEVHGLGHGDWSPSEAKQWGVARWVSTDVDPDSLLALAVRPNVIIHCAGGGSVGAADQNPFEDFDRSLRSIAAILDFQRASAPDARLVVPSSAAVYGRASLQPIDETAALRPISIYGLHKQLVEQLVKYYAANFRLRISVVRLFSLYGVGLRKQLFWDACRKIAGGDFGFPGTGDEIRDWLHVDDAVDLLRLATEHADAACPVANGSAGRGRSVASALARIAARFGREGEIIFTGEQRPNDPSRYEANIARALQWGWRPRQDMDAALDAYVDWFKATMA
jgi:UDP-glucose 4-epimerase